MKTEDLIANALKLNPHEVVKADLDCFEAYVCVEWPSEINDEIETIDDLELWEEFESEYIVTMQKYGAVKGIARLQKLFLGVG